MLAWGFILLGSLACLGAAHPIQNDVEPQWMLRQRRSPMASGGGYNYERPDRAFNPYAGMPAYVTGGSSKHDCKDSNKLVEAQPEASQPDKEEPKSAESPYSQEPEVPKVVESSKAPVVPQRKAKSPKAAKRPPTVEDEDDDEEDEDDSVARKGGRPGGSVYRNFFPMTFGGSGSRLRVAEDGEGGQGGRGSVTAIGNSFSKGRGAIASSSAVAHGSPEASQTRQSSSQQSRYRARA